jgi:Na+/proline symporter
MTNILVTSMLLTGTHSHLISHLPIGGAAVVNALTGLPNAVTCFVLPLGVVFYTSFGGIKATFLTDYVHTVIILLIIMVFSLTVYATSDKLGSPGIVYDLLQQAAQQQPVQGNSAGSYLTMHSHGGVVFFVINIVGNFGTVFCDAGYYQKAISADPASALSGYLLGGLAWFAIPWLCATTMGLAAIVLQTDPAFPTYPNPLSDTEISAGLVLPYAAVTLLGTGGAIATLLYRITNEKS